MRGAPIVRKDPYEKLRACLRVAKGCLKQLPSHGRRKLFYLIEDLANSVPGQERDFRQSSAIVQTPSPCDQGWPKATKIFVTCSQTFTHSQPKPKIQLHH